MLHEVHLLAAPWVDRFDADGYVAKDGMVTFWAYREGGSNEYGRERLVVADYVQRNILKVVPVR